MLGDRGKGIIMAIYAPELHLGEVRMMKTFLSYRDVSGLLRVHDEQGVGKDSL